MAKKNLFPLFFAIGLTSYTTFAVLDTFVIEKNMGSVSFDSNFFDDESSLNSFSSSRPSSSFSSSKEDKSSSSSSKETSSSNSGSSIDDSSSKEVTSSGGNSSSSSIVSSSSNLPPVNHPDSYFTDEPVLLDDWYSDNNINIQIFTDTVTVLNNNNTEVETVVYTADIRLRSIKYLKTALANDSFGENITEKTTSMAKRNNAILAINGDYYGAQEKGYVLRNGTVLRETKKDKKNDKGDLAIYTDGSFEHFKENDYTLKDIQNLKTDKGLKAYQVFSFGPSLVLNGERNVTESDEVAVFSTKGNQRTAIGFIDNLHYIFSVCDGRLKDSWGMKLYQMADFMISKGCKSAYNLDGGGSATFVFNGKLMNRPNTNGEKDLAERKISDCVYIAA